MDVPKLLAASLAAVLGIAPAAAGAPPATPSMTCSFSPSEQILRLTVGPWGDNGKFLAGSKGGDLAASELSLADTNPPSVFEEPIPCTEGTPTVTNVDRIDVGQTEPRGDYSSASFLLDLSGGPLAPGVTAEASGLSEIEADVDLPGAEVGVAGTSRRDRYELGFTKAELGLNVNGDDDLDVTISGAPFFDVYGGAGRDSISGRRSRITERPRRDIRAFIVGDGGRDRLIAGGKRDQLSGGGGADVLKGGKAAGVLQGDGGPDRIFSAPGAQLLLGGRGADWINARDGDQDDIDCGGGEDTAIVDRHEGPLGLERCEHVMRPQ
jgi:hypothetical protein